MQVYASILYLNMPQNFLIILRGKVVEHRSIASDLKFTQYIAYKPQTGAAKKDVISWKPHEGCLPLIAPINEYFTSAWIKYSLL